MYYFFKVVILMGIYPSSSPTTNLRRMGEFDSDFNSGFMKMKAFKDWVLDVTAIRSLTTESRYTCGLECLEQIQPDACLSINLKNMSDNTFECSLLATDKYRSYSNFTAEHGSTHYAIVTKCLENPCQDGSICIPDYSSDQFECREKDIIKLPKNEGTATQKSTYQDAKASFAVDGDYNRCTGTKGGNDQWFKFKFTFNALIESVEVYSLIELSGELDNALIYIYTTLATGANSERKLCGNTGIMRDIVSKRIHCANHLKGNTVEIVSGKSLLSLCEIDVYGVII